MKLKTLVPLLLPLTAVLVSGCDGGQGNSLNIQFSFITPTAYVGEEYDFSDVLSMEEGVNYSIDVYYQNFYTMEEKTLPVTNGFSFTPTELFDVSVLVTAKKGRATAQKTKNVPVSQRADPVDELLESSGDAGWADNGFSKELITDSTYFKEENGHSALSVRYQGSNPYPWGGVFMTLNSFFLLPHWTDQTWENAVISFWIFNSTDYALEFQPRIVDEYTGLTDIDWGNQLIVPQFAEPNGWTEINFSLKHMGIQHPLFVDEDGIRNDTVSIKTKWAGTPESGDEVYNYQFFLDGVDIVPYTADRFPNVDTTSYATAETLDYGWENMERDDGWSSAGAVYDRDFVNSSAEHDSLSSMLLSFNVKEPIVNGYAVVLSPEAQFGNDELPSFTHGVLELDVHFSADVTNHSMEIIAVQKEWTHSTRFAATPASTANGWDHLTIDFGEHEQFVNISEGVRLGFAFPGVDASNKATAEVHLDNIFFDQYAGVPEPETIADGWENAAIDTGWSSANTAVDNNESKDSASSLKVTFDGKEQNAANGYAVILNLETTFAGSAFPDIHQGTIEMDIKFSSDITNHEIEVFAVQNGWNIPAVRAVVSPSSVDENGWAHLTLDFGADAAFNVITECIRLGFGFKGVDNNNKETATTYLDNIIFTENEL